MVTILFIEDQVLLRTALVNVIENLFKNIKTLESSSITSFRQLHPEQTPHLIIMSVNSRLLNVTSNILQQIKKDSPRSKLMVYDDYENAESIAFVFKMGADGYLLKKNSVEQLAEGIQNLLDGKRYLPTELFKLIIPKLTKKRDSLKIIPNLTVRESQIAAFLIQDMDTGIIAKKLGRNSATISVIKKNILKKMNVNSISELKEAYHKLP